MKGLVSSTSDGKNWTQYVMCSDGTTRQASACPTSRAAAAASGRSISRTLPRFLHSSPNTWPPNCAYTRSYPTLWSIRWWTRSARPLPPTASATAKSLSYRSKMPSASAPASAAKPLCKKQPAPSSLRCGSFIARNAKHEFFVKICPKPATKSVFSAIIGVGNDFTQGLEASKLC